MRRPRNPLPLSLGDISYNPISAKYEITDCGIIYQMDLEHTRSLKSFFKDISIRGKGATISDWYNELERETKKEINRIGSIEIDCDFYPDQPNED